MCQIFLILERKIGFLNWTDSVDKYFSFKQDLSNARHSSRWWCHLYCQDTLANQKTSGRGDKVFQKLSSQYTQVHVNRWGDNDWNSIFGWTAPLMLHQYVKFFQRTVSNEFIMWLLLRTGETMLIWDLFRFFFRQEFNCSFVKSRQHERLINTWIRGRYLTSLEGQRGRKSLTVNRAFSDNLTSDQLHFHSNCKKLRKRRRKRFTVFVSTTSPLVELTMKY